MIWEFYQTEEQHDKSSIAYDVVMNGQNRFWRFCNDPKNQRIAHCQECGIKIPKEVPRIKYDASYSYGAGYYCMSCGIQKIKNQREHFLDRKEAIEKELLTLDELEEVAKKVIGNEFYVKKMALAKMLQVMEPEKKDNY